MPPSDDKPMTFAATHERMIGEIDAKLNATAQQLSMLTEQVSKISTNFEILQYRVNDLTERMRGTEGRERDQQKTTNNNSQVLIRDIVYWVVAAGAILVAILKP
jgi:regulator of replication initiation timing